MINSEVRIECIEINNFKNVNYGILDFKSSKKKYSASVLGLYGQNGSGKTALIDSLELLKYVLTGESIPVKFADCINIGSESATFKFYFEVNNKHLDALYNVVYEFSIRKETSISSDNTLSQEKKKSSCIAELYNEVISYSYCSKDEKVNKSTIINTNTNDVFLPKTKRDLLVGKDKEILTNLLVSKKIAMLTSRSFIFSSEFLDVVRKNCSVDYHRFLLESLVQYGNFELFVINTDNTGLISMDALPLSFKYEKNDGAAIGNFAIPLQGISLIPEKAFYVVEKVISDMNVVLRQIIPGLTIDVRNLGLELFENGEKGCRIQLISNKNSKSIPLQYESEGIKKIISILHLLIVVYNKKSITVAIDELDSGVFEYLLGELLQIISEKGKGQLIFTSHNLRPLETLDRGFIAFTTTNPLNRYIRMLNVKTNNNLRDLYYRDIVLGEQDEIVYEPTNNYEIAFAFREAGALIGS